MPYNIQESNGKYKVVKDDGEVLGTHGTKEEARDQQQALYVNEADDQVKASRLLTQLANNLDKKGLYKEANVADVILKALTKK